MKEIKNLTIGTISSNENISFNNNYLDNDLMFENGTFKYDKLKDVIIINSKEKLKKMIALMQVYNNGFYFFKNDSKTPLNLKELKELGIIKKINDKYDFSFDVNKYFKKYWEKLFNTEIKNFSVYGYESHFEVCLCEKTYYNNELFENGTFNFNYVDKVGENINSTKDLIDCINALLCWKWDTFYIFKEDSKMPLTINELEELGIIEKRKDYKEMLKSEWNFETHSFLW